MDEQNKGPIAKRFGTDHSQREQILDRARLAASLTKPWILPHESQDANQKLPEPYQSIGARGMTNLEGRMLLALFPPSTPWFQFDLVPEVKYDPNLTPDLHQEIRQSLFLRELQVQATIESANLKNAQNRQRIGFRSKARMALSQIIGTGDVLIQMTDDFVVKVFRRDQYVTNRDTSLNVLYHIAKERIDPLSLTEEQRAKSQFVDAELTQKESFERLDDLYTLIEWQPLSDTWVIKQEINGQQIVQSEEAISPFFAVPFELVPGEDYGRGFIELNLGDLRSHDGLEEKILDFAAMASKMVPVLDYSSNMQESDLTKPSGIPIRGRVQSGKVADHALLTVDKFADFSVVMKTSERKEKALSKAMLLESELQPQKERVTATQIQRIAMELEGALGGFYAPIAEGLQMPLIERTTHLLEKKNLMQAIPGDSVRIDTLTGLSALRREVEKGKVLDAVQIIGQLGPEAIQRINIGVLVDVLLRYQGVHEPGLIKTEEQLADEVQQTIDAQTQQEAASKAVDVAGNVVQEQTTQQPDTAAA